MGRVETNTDRMLRLGLTIAGVLALAGITMFGSSYLMISHFTPQPPNGGAKTVEKYICPTGTVMLRGLDEEDQVIRVCVPGRTPIAERDYAKPPGG